MRLILTGTQNNVKNATIEISRALTETMNHFSDTEIQEVYTYDSPEGVPLAARDFCERFGIAYKEFPRSPQSNNKMLEDAEAVIVVWNQQDKVLKHLVDEAKQLGVLVHTRDV